ncbi:MAG: MBL fold metallo-hydrolase [Turicibacter sp.]|nr:MBL fold metallo-hydrolase [Turicibacter sp.]
METKMRFWGGLRTIGGTVVEICYGGDRVIFDFGRAYNAADTIIADLQNIKKREKTRIKDMIRLGILPGLDGIYDKEHLEELPIEAAPGNTNTAIFITHLHLDHMANIGLVSEKVPIFMSQEGLELHKELFPPVKSLRAFEYEESVQIGAIKVTGYAVDHDVRGASALLIETPDRKMAYSGDIRMHGLCVEKNDRWIRAMNEKKLDFLLMEGTMFFPPDPNYDSSKIPPHISEADVPVLIAQKLRETAGVAFFNFYPSNIERMENFIKIEAGRQIVFEEETARIVQAFLPKYNVHILGKNISITQINENPQKYFVQNSLVNILDLLDYQVEGSVYIHSNGIPLGPFDPAFGGMKSFLENLGIEYFSASCSGHARREDILDIIERISPKTLVPWHSQAPEEIAPPNIAILLPEFERWY